MSTPTDMVSTSRTEMGAQAMNSWANSLATVLESMTEHRPTIAVCVAQCDALDETFSWWGQSLSILDQPSFWIGAPEKSWLALGRLTLSALGAEEPGDSDVEATCRDLMAQTSAVVASELTQQLGQEITGRDSIPGSRPNSAAALLFTWSLDAGQMSMEGAAVWSEAFLSRCSSLTPQPAPANARADQSSAPSGPEMQFGGRPAASLPRLDLRVKFILGRTTLLLRDVFKLNTGSVIELDSSVNEPAEVIIDGRVLARGQVVVVNGNYGLKILPREL